MSFNTPDQLGFTLLPPDPGIISPDLALEAALAPVVDLQPPPVAPLGRGWAFDFTINEFLLHGSAPAEVYDTDNLRMWIEKTLRTARYTYPIFSEDYGMADPFAMIGQPFSADLIGDYEEQVLQALLVHDRIVSVENFSYQQADDALYVQFSVVLDGNPVQTLALNTVVSLPTS
jgi:hypothetical protein